MTKIILQIATNKKIVPWTATFRSINLRADCEGVIPVVANRGTFERGLPRAYSCCGKPGFATTD
jgi:hypothetical protein